MVWGFPPAAPDSGGTSRQAAMPVALASAAGGTRQLLDCHAVDTRAPSFALTRVSAAQEVGSLDHASMKAFVIAWRAFSRCSNRGFTPLLGKGQYELLVRCGASVQHPGASPSYLSGFGPLRGPTTSADSSHGSTRLPAWFSQFPWHATSRGAWEASRGKLSYRPCIDAEFIKHRPACGWRALRLRARSPRLYHTSYPVRVPRPTRSFHAAFRRPPRGDALALPLSFGSTYTWTGDFHPRA